MIFMAAWHHTRYENLKGPEVPDTEHGHGHVVFCVKREEDEHVRVFSEEFYLELCHGPGH